MIRNYIDSDIKEIEELTYKLWFGEIESDIELSKFIYGLLSRLYLNSNLCFVDYEDKLNGFIMLNDKHDSKIGIDYFNDNLDKLSIDNHNKALKYKEYLDYNHNKVIKYMDDNSIYLGLIASDKKGIGSKLYDYAINKIKANKIYLWTDETCNYNYYLDNDFKLEESYYVDFFGKKIKTFIFSKLI